MGEIIWAENFNFGLGSYKRLNLCVSGVFITNFDYFGKFIDGVVRINWYDVMEEYIKYVDNCYLRENHRICAIIFILDKKYAYVEYFNESIELYHFDNLKYRRYSVIEYLIKDIIE